MADFPIGTAYHPDQFSMDPVANVQIFESELNGTIQTGALPGDHWEGTATWTNRDGTNADTLIAFFRGLRGAVTPFTMYPFDRPTPKGTALGTPVVNGADQSGTTLITSGWTPSQTECLAVGDYVQIGDELKQIDAAIASDGTGAATLSFYPPIRKPPANGSAVVTDHPRGVFKLSGPRPDSSVRSPIIYALSVAFREVV